MTAKSYITLGITGILYVIIAAIAIISPHGIYTKNEALANESQPENISITDENGEPVGIKLLNGDGIEVVLPLDGLQTFATVQITLKIDGQNQTFNAVNFKSVMDWSGFAVASDIIVVKDTENNHMMYRTVDLKREGNAYVIYADANGNPLNESDYGNCCLYLAEGDHAGLFLKLNSIDFG